MTKVVTGYITIQVIFEYVKHQKLHITGLYIAESYLPLLASSEKGQKLGARHSFCFLLFPFRSTLDVGHNQYQARLLLSFEAGVLLRQAGF